MSNRKSNVIIIFTIMLIAMNLIAVTQMIATNNNQFDGDNTPYSLVDASNEAIVPEDPSLKATSEIPSLRNWDLSINTSRIIRHYDYGYLTINDNITLINNDNLSLPIFRFSIPQHLAVNLVEISASSMWAEFDVPLNSTNVEIEYQDGNFTYYIMALNPIVNNASLYKIQIHQTYLRPYEIFIFKSEDNHLYNGIKMNVSRMPFLSLPIHTARTTFLKADDGIIISSHIYPNELATIGDASVLYNPIYSVPAYNFSNEYESNSDDYTYKVQIAGYTSFTSSIEATNYLRTISISVKKINSEIELSVAVKPDPVIAKHRYFQDWIGWIEKNYCDFVVPMNYKTDWVEFDSVLKQVLNRKIEKKIMIGISTYNQDVLAVMQRLEVVKSDGFAGYSLFSFNHLRDNRTYLNELRHQILAGR